MSVELILKRISSYQLNQMHKHGVDSVIAGLWERDSASHRAEWLHLDAHILGFMQHENPKHDTLYEAVMGGKPFKDSPGRDDYPRFFDPTGVERVAAALNNVTEDALETRFAATRQIFGGLCINGTDEQALARLKGRFKEVARYYRQAAQNGEAMLLLLH